jgi:ParB-like chromosome segregation protein Spo0J
MVDLPQYPPLKSLHPESSLNAGKLEKMQQVPTEALLASLLPGLKDCLKTRPEGTILDGHHRIHILRKRGVDVDSIPREIVIKDQE